MTPDKTHSEALAQLRHLYANLTSGGVRDTASAKRIAEGLLSPAIAALEKWGSHVVAGEPVAWRLKDEEASRHYGKEIYVYYGKEDFQEGVDPCDFIAGIEALTTPTPTQVQAGAVPQPVVKLGPDGKEWTKTEAGYVHVDEMLPRADGHCIGPFWYGWALRGAFVAGAEWQEARHTGGIKEGGQHADR